MEFVGFFCEGDGRSHLYVSPLPQPFQMCSSTAVRRYSKFGQYRHLAVKGVAVSYFTAAAISEGPCEVHGL
jgi:hypothetical protein